MIVSKSYSPNRGFDKAKRSEAECGARDWNEVPRARKQFGGWSKPQSDFLRRPEILWKSTGLGYGALWVQLEIWTNKSQLLTLNQVRGSHKVNHLRTSHGRQRMAPMKSNNLGPLHQAVQLPDVEIDSPSCPQSSPAHEINAE